jgi:DNA-binding MarR family transcriptional regulator
METRLTRDISVPELAREMERKLQNIRQALRKPLEAQYARGHLTGPQMLVMEVVCKQDGISMKELASRMGLAHSTVSGIVDRLEKRGLLIRQTLESDRRVTQILPSPAVREFLQKQAPALTLHPLNEALKRASAAERKTVWEGITMLEKLLTEG